MKESPESSVALVLCAVMLAGWSLVALAAGARWLYWKIRNREEEAAELRRFEARRRGKIVKVGHIVIDPLGREQPWDFHIDGENEVPALAQGPRGELLFAGYTREELLEIARRPEEFQP